MWEGDHHLTYFPLGLMVASLSSRLRDGAQEGEDGRALCGGGRDPEATCTILRGTGGDQEGLHCGRS